MKNPIFNQINLCTSIFFLEHYSFTVPQHVVFFRGFAR